MYGRYAGDTYVEVAPESATSDRCGLSDFKVGGRSVCITLPAVSLLLVA
jgi:hypothetical protein